MGRPRRARPRALDRRGSAWRRDFARPEMIGEPGKAFRSVFAPCRRSLGLGAQLPKDFVDAYAGRARMVGPRTFHPWAAAPRHRPAARTGQRSAKLAAQAGSTRLCGEPSIGTRVLRPPSSRSAREAFIRSQFVKGLAAGLAHQPWSMGPEFGRLRTRYIHGHTDQNTDRRRRLMSWVFAMITRRARDFGFRFRDGRG